MHIDVYNYEHMSQLFECLLENYSDEFPQMLPKLNKAMMSSLEYKQRMAAVIKKSINQLGDTDAIIYGCQ